MGSGGIIIILKRNVQTALNLGLNSTGTVKIKHALIASHVIAFLIGLAF